MSWKCADINVFISQPDNFAKSLRVTRDDDGKTKTFLGIFRIEKKQAVAGIDFYEPFQYVEDLFFTIFITTV